MKLLIFLSVILAVIASLATGTPISATPHDILESSEPVESDILSDIEYSTVLNTKLAHGFGSIADAAGRMEREAESAFAVPVGSNTYATLSTLLSVIGLVALVAFVAMFATRTITSRSSVNRRGCYSQLVNSRRVASPLSLHHPDRTSPLGLSPSASWHNFDRVPSV